MLVSPDVMMPRWGSQHLPAQHIPPRTGDQVVVLVQQIGDRSPLLAVTILMQNMAWGEQPGGSWSLSMTAEHCHTHTTAIYIQTINFQ